MHTLSTLTQDSFPSQHIVASSNSGTLSWGQLMADVAATRLLICARDHTGWALFEEDSYLFSVALLALLAEGRRVYIPGENHSGIVDALLDERVQFMGLFPAASGVIDIPNGSDTRVQSLEIRGEIVERGEALALFDAPAHAYTKSLLAAAHLA